MSTRPKKGYELSIDRKNKVVTIRGWGLWDKELAQTYLEEYKKKATEISAGGAPWYVLVDYRDFPAQTREVQEIVKKAMRFSRDHGVRKQARVVPDMVTSMQIKRLSEETGLPENAHFASETEALQWLLEG